MTNNAPFAAVGTTDGGQWTVNGTRPEGAGTAGSLSIYEELARRRRRAQIAARRALEEAEGQA
jgi:hypothetical protein